MCVERAVGTRKRLVVTVPDAGGGLTSRTVVAEQLIEERGVLYLQAWLPNRLERHRYRLDEISNCYGLDKRAA